MARVDTDREEGRVHDVDLDYTLELFVEVFNARVNEEG